MEKKVTIDLIAGNRGSANVGQSTPEGSQAYSPHLDKTCHLDMVLWRVNVQTPPGLILQKALTRTLPNQFG